MRTITVSLLVLVCCLVDFSFGQSCSGITTLRTPVRSFVASRPVRGLFQKIGNRAAASCGSSAAATPSCGSSVQATGCAGSTVVPQAGPVPTSVAGCSCGCEQGAPCTCQKTYTQYVAVRSPQENVPTCANGTCSLGESQQSFGSEEYQRALRSATYRAQTGTKGHVAGELVSGRANSAGVGYSSFNSNPRTCLGVPGQTSATCAVVRGADGWYSTCVK